MNLIKLIIPIVFISLLGSCSNSNRKLENKLREAIINKSNLAIQKHMRYSEIRLSEITNFKWDKFYIFEEYVTNKDINNITGIDWEGTDVPSGRRRLLFIYKKKIIDYVDFTPEIFPVFFFTCGGTIQFEFSKKDDLLAVLKKYDKDGCVYAMVPKRCIESWIRNR